MLTFAGTKPTDGFEQNSKCDMKEPRLIMSAKDHADLTRLVQNANMVEPSQKRPLLRLKYNLSRAEIRPQSEVPNNVVQLGSAIDLDTPYGLKSGLELVLPQDVGYTPRRISVLSPLGIALIGKTLGDHVDLSDKPQKQVLQVIGVLPKDEELAWGAQCTIVASRFPADNPD